MSSGAAIATTMGEYLIVQMALPGQAPENIGVLLLDPGADQLYLRFRRDWPAIASEEDAEVFAELADDLAMKAREGGAAEFLRDLEDKLSNSILISPRETLMVSDFDAAADRLYRANVAPKVLAFRTHLPKFSLRAAAGKFGEHMEVEAEDWEEMPPDLRLTEDMFIAHVVGRSMLPKIPDGSECVFRGQVVGSRNGKLVLVMHYGETGENRFTVKRYRSIKMQTEDGWAHEKIILEPLNPEFEPWELTEDSPIKVIGEFVRVLR
jgi:SOS-response transcriptional repressor LexA